MPSHVKLLISLVHDNANRAHVVSDVSFGSEFDIVTTVIGTISENVFDDQILGRQVGVLFQLIVERVPYLLQTLLPGLFWPCGLLFLLLILLRLLWLLFLTRRQTLIPFFLFHLEFILILFHLMLDPPLGQIHFDIGLFQMSLDFLIDIGVNKIINLIIQLHLILGNEAHVEHPLLVVFILGTQLDELLLTDGLALVEIILCELCLVHLFYFLRRYTLVL
jgi:hypothetical protein